MKPPFLDRIIRFSLIRQQSLIGPEFNTLITSISAFGTFALLSYFAPVTLIAGLIIGYSTTNPYFWDRNKGESLNSSSPFKPEKAPETGFSDLVQVPSVTEKLQNIASIILDVQEGYNPYELDPPIGVLMYGPPGTGKTALTRALAHELDASIFVVSASDILGKMLGETEQKIKVLFDAVIAQRQKEPEKPVILFMDEIDALGRRDDEMNASKVAMPALIQRIDGYHTLPEGILFVGATNCLYLVDTALQDRLKLIETKLPNEEQRKGLFKHYISDQVSIEETLSLSELAEKTNHRSCRQIRDLVREAKIKAHFDAERDPKQLLRSDFSV